MGRFYTPSRISENIVETPEGYLLCLGVPIARTGWQEYGPGETPLEAGPDGKVWVHREGEEVFRPQTVASFNGKSITIKHPDDFVEPANWKTLTHGVAQNVRKGEEADEDGEEALIADLLITDAIAIQLVKNGLREVSCGYDADYEQTGEGEGRQLNIVGNHIALVEQGRAGPAYAIRDHKTKGENAMSVLKDLAEKIKNIGKTVDEAVAADAGKKKALDAAKAKAAKDGKADDADEGEDASAYDDLMKAVKDIGEKVEALKSGKQDEGKDEDEEEDEMEDDAEEENGAGKEALSRIKALEAAVAKILKQLGSEDEDEEESEESGEDDDMAGEDDSEEMSDEEGEEGEESQKKTGDAAHVEILTPGQKFKGKDARVKCLKAFAKGDEGREVLKQLGMSKPVFDAKTNVDMLFLAASALVKSKRGTGLSGTKDGRRFMSGDEQVSAGKPMTPEAMNELNAKHWQAK